MCGAVFGRNSSDVPFQEHHEMFGSRLFQMMVTMKPQQCFTEHYRYLFLIALLRRPLLVLCLMRSLKCLCLLPTHAWTEIGEDLSVFTSRILCKEPGTGKEIVWHQDRCVGFHETTSDVLACSSHHLHWILEDFQFFKTSLRTVGFEKS